MKQEKIWQYFQNEGISSFENNKGRLRFLAKQIQKKASRETKVLNIGVGNGVFEKIAVSYGFDVYSLDPDNRTISRLTEDYRMKGKAKVGYCQEIPFNDNFFDFIVVSEVLEHLSDETLAKARTEFRRILKNQGVLIGTVPARENLEKQIVVCPKCGETFHRWGHLQSFTKEKMTDWLSPEFEVKTIKEKFFWSTLNWKGKSVAFTKLVIQILLNSFASGQSIYFYAQKK